MLVKLLTSKTLTEEDAVKYLLDTRLSKGKWEASYSGYAPTEHLTRAETITFIKRLTTPVSRPQVSLN